MKTNMKSIISLALAFALVISCIPGTALVTLATEAATTYDKPTGRAIAVNYDGYMADSGKDWAEELLATLPANATIDGAGEYAITWPTADEVKAIVNPDLTGFYSIPGVVDGIRGAVAATIQVREVANMLYNPSFETGSWNNADGWGGGYYARRSTNVETTGWVTPTAADGAYSFQIQTNPNTATASTQLRYQTDAKAVDLAAAVKAAGEGQYYLGISALDSTPLAEGGADYPEHEDSLFILPRIYVTEGTTVNTAKSYAIGTRGEINRETWSKVGSVFTLTDLASYNWLRTDFVLVSDTAFTSRYIFLDMAEMIPLNVPLKAEPEETIVSVNTELPALAIAKDYDVYAGENWQDALGLPATVEVTTDKGETVAVNVIWDYSKVDFSKRGVQIVTGALNSATLFNDKGLTVQQRLYVAEAENLFTNASFETGWTAWAGQYNLAWKISQPASGDYAVAARSHITYCLDNFSYCLLKSTTTTNCVDVAEKVAALGAGQYYVGAQVKDFVYGDEETHADPLGAFIKLSSNKDGSATYKTVGVGETVAISYDNYVSVGATYELDGTDKALFTELYLASTSKFYGQWVLVDDMQFIPLKVTMKEEPAYVEEVITELTEYSIAKDYDAYVGENWQNALGLPTAVEVITSEGEKVTVEVTWDYSKVDFTQLGEQTITGMLSEKELFNTKGLTVQQRLYVVEAENLFTNASFETGWTAWAGQYNLAWKISQPASGDYAVAARSHITYCLDNFSYCLLKSTTTTNCVDVAEKVAALGAGQYYVGAQVKDFVYGDEETHADPLGAFIKLSSNKDGGATYKTVGVGETVAISYDNYVSVGATYELDGTDKALFTELYLASTSKFYGQWVLVDDMQFIPLKVAYVEPAECAHEWDEGVVDPAATCTKDGVITYTCALCNETKTDVIPATGEHAWDEGVIKPDATCTEEGVKTYTCGTCGETKTEAVSALGHTKAEPVIENEKAPTCVAAGSYDSVVYCSVCKAELSRETIPGDPATGEHTYDNDQDADCNICGAQREIEPAECEHAWDDGVETIPAGRDTKGERTYTCGKCGETKKEEIPALLRFASWNVTLKNNIQVNFIGHAANLTTDGYTDMYAVITIESKTEGVTTEVTVYQKDCEIDSQGRPVFSFTELAPDMLSNKITATLYAKHNGREYVSAVIEKDVTGYVDSQLEKLAGATTEKDKKLRTLMVDLLNYATAVQEQSGYKKYPAINSVLTETEKSWASNQEVTAVKDTNLPKTPFEGELLVWKTASLSLGDAVIPYFKFECADLTGITIEVECAGSKYEYACDLAEKWLEWSASDSRYRFNFIDLGVTRMREPIYLTAYKDGVAVSHTLTYSVQSYCDGKLTAGTTLNDVCIAMLKYGDAAKAYVNCPG